MTLIRYFYGYGHAGLLTDIFEPLQRNVSGTFKVAGTGARFPYSRAEHLYTLRFEGHGTFHYLFG
jgi:hypothetical protein